MKKNPLNDLDQFLQQEAHSIVEPSSLSDKLKQGTPAEKPVQPTHSVEEQLMALARQNPKQFYDTLIAIGEQMDTTKNTMLINTALYLKYGDAWKDEVKRYWQR